MKKYLVLMKDTLSLKEFKKVFSHVGKPSSMPDFVIVKTHMGIERIREMEGVLLVEEDENAEILQQEEDVGYALPWISDAPEYNNRTTGSGVDIYVIDTGIRGSHKELNGRVRNLYSFDGVPYSVTSGDSPFHGTSVAACAAGARFGTAPQATVYNCRSNFSLSDILKSLDTILRHHLDKPDNRPSVVNFSGASPSFFIGRAFERLTKYGVVIVAAAGNSSGLLPEYPARNAWVTSVGAVNELSGKAWFSNSQCDLYAPGQGITTADVTSDVSTRVVSGTSFACPYYAGLLACLLEGSDKFNTAAQVSQFNHQMRNSIGDNKRLTFTNGSLQARSVTSNGLDGEYYISPLRGVRDKDIAHWLIDNIDNPSVIAAACKEYNLSKGRIIKILGGGEGLAEEIDKYFKSCEVWWD